MRFWDTSAIVPLIVREPSSTACRHEHRVEPQQTVSRITRLEATDALYRKLREGVIASGELRMSLRALDMLASRWSVIELTEEVDDDACALVARHPLRAADAVQLAAARVATGGHPRSHAFLTRDEVLSRAAAAEGFRVIVPKR